MSKAVWIAAIQVETTDHLPVTIVESREFQKDALSVWSEEELVELKMRIATNPTCGVRMPHTGGVRKLRYGANGKGTRGGARVIYYYHSPAMPIFLLGFFLKSEKVDLTMGEKADIKQFVRQLVAEYRRGALRVVT